MPENKELREAGYFDRAKVLVLCELRTSVDPADHISYEEATIPSSWKSRSNLYRFHF